MILRGIIEEIPVFSLKCLVTNTIDGLKDGTHVFTMRGERLEKNAHKYEHTNDEDEVTSIDFREKAIAASYVGVGFSPILKINRIPKDEGEITAAKNSVNKLSGSLYDIEIWDEESIFH